MRKNGAKEEKEVSVKKLSKVRQKKIKKRIEKVKQEQIMTIGCCFLTLLLFILLFLYVTIPTLTLRGDSEIILNYKKNYKEAGYKASYLNHDITGYVKVKGEVNPKKLGKYKITYTIKRGLFTTEAVRTVIVSDKMKPKISLKGSKDFYICPNQKYEEPGYSAFDNYDKDITENVKTKTYNNKIIYYVRDKSHNFAKAERKITYGDKTKPKINLKGGNIIYAFVGEEFKDPSFTATDNCDKDLTAKVTTSGEVDTTKPGNYELTYKVSDEAGNTTIVKRTVIVANKGQNGTIYLTFDDGPRDGTTNVILDILRDNGVKATFFVTNNGPDELIKREFDEGHTVGLHTATHNYAYLYSSKEAYFEDLTRVHDRVQRITGNDSKIIRFPGGSSNTISRHYVVGLMTTLTEEVIRQGYHFHDWNLNSGDAGEYRDAEQIYQHVIANLSKDRINVILMHDIKPYTRDALDKIIKYGKENGYIFDKITMDTEMTHQKVNN